MGGNYTYSNHTTRDILMNPIVVRIGNMNLDSHYYNEYSIKEHCASIKVNITDSQEIKKEFVFNHGNGIGLGYSNLDGLGIYSFIKALKLMKRVDELGGWAMYDFMMDIKMRIGAKLYHNSFNSTQIAELIEEELEISHEIISKYHKGYFRSIGLELKTRKSNFKAN